MKTNLAAAILVLAALSCGEKKGPPPAPPPPVVYVTPVAKRDVALYIESVAALDGYDNAEIRARVKGFLRTQGYKDGSRVKSGDLLFTIEATDYTATVASSAANLQRAKVARDHNRIRRRRDLEERSIDIEEQR